MITKKILSAAILGLFAAQAHAVSFTQGDWTMDLSGSVNAFYTQSNCNTSATGYGALGVCSGPNQDTATIQNGLLPGFINFTASSKQSGYDVKANIGIHPGTSNSLASGGSSGGAGQSVGDARQIWLSFGNDRMGTVKLGRDIGLFQQQAILNDMTLLGVGTGANFRGAINTTTGMIGNGYVYVEFKPQITYTLPTSKEWNVSAGIFTPNADGQGGRNTKTPGLQGLASYDGGPFKVWGSFINQETETPQAVPAVTVSKFKTDGFELGGKAGYSGLEVMLVGFTGKGLGTAVATLDGFAGTGASAGTASANSRRKSDGALGQVTYKIGDTKLGLSYGESRLKLAGGELSSNQLERSRAYTLGVYHSLTKNLTLVGEYVEAKQRAQNTAVNPEAKAKTLAAGAIVFF